MTEESKKTIGSYFKPGSVFRGHTTYNERERTFEIEIKNYNPLSRSFSARGLDSKGISDIYGNWWVTDTNIRILMLQSYKNAIIKDPPIDYRGSFCKRPETPKEILLKGTYGKDTSILGKWLLEPVKKA
jgi:hypothetical protein